ncbi:carboxypeptidase-like regulatory domain-containing protein [Echinicola shivajiensis]|uniref:carboxypeptidase-like regulatory domain-containing protein n=1 Tax=Echinicola shivajiensis TaxID=1035916 RepID=UPI001BFC72A7|nr:carboxypeptidase-like regulatory domain-containing protein [Echinicola shivajiensis]
MKTKQILRTMAYSFLAFGLASFFFGCKAQRVDTQGIIGQVYWVEGNLMPTISDGNTVPEKPPREKVKRKIRIYERTHINEAKMGDLLFSEIETPMVAEIETEEDGSFVIGLPPGTYSVFTVEEGGYFANVFDLDTFIQPVEVLDGEWSNMEILINYKAAY